MKFDEALKRCTKAAENADNYIDKDGYNRDEDDYYHGMMKRACINGNLKMLNYF